MRPQLYCTRERRGADEGLCSKRHQPVLITPFHHPDQPSDENPVLYHMASRFAAEFFLYSSFFAARFPIPIVTFKTRKLARKRYHSHLQVHLSLQVRWAPTTNDLLLVIVLLEQTGPRGQPSPFLGLETGRCCDRAIFNQAGLHSKGTIWMRSLAGESIETNVCRQGCEICLFWLISQDREQES